jgi:folate-binding Fe-S cluster repair protein YgfZ
LGAAAQRPLNRSISMVTKLTGKKLLQITGADAQKTLQNLTTANIEKFISNPSEGLCHTVFLNAAGRVISDAILVKPMLMSQKSGLEANTDTLWMEISDELEGEIRSHIKKHSFRKKIKLEDISNELDIFA